MHIAIVTNYLPPRAGGLEGVVDALARAYAELGDEVVVVGFDDTPGPAPYERERLHGWNPLERRGVPVPILTPGSLLRLRRRVRDADAVHIQGLVFLSSFAALLTCRRNQPVMVTEHVGVVPYRSFTASTLQRLALLAGARLAKRRNAVITALNDRVVAQVAAASPGSSVEKISNGVDLERFTPVSAQRRAELRALRQWSRPTALVVARNAPKKRLDLVLAAAQLLPNVRFVVCGLDTEKLGWSERNVELLGSVEQSTLADHYRAADLLLLPSEGEGQPLCVLEALACGLPVILGADPAVFAELPGCVVPVDRSIDAVVEAITSTLPNDRDRDRVSMTCSNAVAARGWTEVATAYRALLRRGDGLQP